MAFASRLIRFFCLATLLALPVASAHAQQGTISGRVVDAETGEPVVGAAVELLGQAGQAETDAAGEFSVAVASASGAHTVVVTMLGYETARVDGVRTTQSVEVSLRSRALVLNPVVVTASRRQEKALEAPASISVVSSDEIERTIVPTPAENLKGLAGIDMVQTGITQSNIVARGFNNVFSGTLLTIVDNRYARIPSLRFNAHNMIPVTDLDIDRIEVSLGPGAALYGPNAASGVMHIITASPIDRPGSSFSVAGGERSVFHGQLRTAHSLADGAFGFKVSAQYFRGNDFEYTDPEEPSTVERDFLNARWSADARMDFRFAGDAELVFNGGVNTAVKSIELTGIGAAQADGWGNRYFQARFSKGRLFAQAFLNQTDSGTDTYLFRTGESVVDQSRAMALQAQYGFNLGDFQSFTYGVDWQRTEPRTGGTITGRHEDDDLISEVGAYVHSETALGEKVDFVAAVRVDDHSRLANPNISPRAALVLKPSEDQTFRLTFNRAFGTPTSNNLFLDIVAARSEIIPGVLSYDVRALGVPSGGFTFNNECPGGHLSMCMYSPLAPGQQLPANAAVFYDALLQNLARDPQLAALAPALANPGSRPTDPALNTVFRRLNQAAGPGDALFVLDDSRPASIADLRSTIHNTYEVGYKGFLGERLLLAADLWYADVKDFVGPLRIETLNVFFEPTSLKAFLDSRLAGLVAAGVLDAATAAGTAGLIAGLAAQIPVGSVVPDQVQSSDFIVTYRNFGEVDYWGADFAAQFLASDRVRINGSYSHQSQECFDFNEDGNCRSADDIALNAPNHKGSVGVTFDDRAAGFSLNARMRMSAGFPMNSGVYVGDVDGYTVVDAGLSYRLPFQPNASVSVSASNLLNNLHQEFIGAPELGRLLLARVRFDF